MISLTPKDRWTFNRYMEEVFHLSEIDEIPGIAQARDELIKEMWKKFPSECKSVGLTDGLEIDENV